MVSEQQHYVPRFLLRNFTCGKKPKIFVYDKANDKHFQTNVKNVAAENGFYDLQSPETILTLEPSLAHLETSSSGIIKKIVHKKNIGFLNEDDSIMLAMFLAVQSVRTKEQRLRFEHLCKLLEQKFQRMGGTEKDIEQIKNSTSESKLVGLKLVLDAIELAPYFLNKVWVLLETSHKHPFFNSDNPLVLHNEVDHKPYGNLGLAVRGIEIYLPISTTLCLGLLCPTIAEKFQKARESMEVLDRVAPSMADSVTSKSADVRTFCNGMTNGTSIKITEDNVTMLNSLQVMYSSRFVYCETNSFELVEKMLSANKKYRGGLKPKIS
jgi:hypothetical protein